MLRKSRTKCRVDDGIHIHIDIVVVVGTENPYDNDNDNEQKASTTFLCSGYAGLGVYLAYREDRAHEFVFGWEPVQITESLLLQFAPGFLIVP